MGVIAEKLSKKISEEIHWVGVLEIGIINGTILTERMFGGNCHYIGGHRRLNSSVMRMTYLDLVLFPPLDNYVKDSSKK